MGSNIGAELARAQVIVENRDVDFIQQVLSFLNRAGRLSHVAVFPQDCGAEQQVIRMIVEQQHADRCAGGLHESQRGILVVRRHKYLFDAQFRKLAASP
jgi:hypothetical protein